MCIRDSIRTEAFDTSQIKRVFIDTLWNPVPKAQAKRDGKLRARGGVKSPIITDVAKGDRLTVLDAMEKWSKVRTEDGYMGYIENRRLEEQEPEPQLSTCLLYTSGRMTTLSSTLARRRPHRGRSGSGVR